jgi:hypothetical protein
VEIDLLGPVEARDVEKRRLPLKTWVEVPDAWTRPKCDSARIPVTLRDNRTESFDVVGVENLWQLVERVVLVHCNDMPKPLGKSLEEGRIDIKYLKLFVNLCRQNF